VIALGTLDPGDAYPFQVRVFVDDGNGNAFVDLTPATGNLLTVHASPGTPGVDLLIDDAVEGAGLTYPNNTGYLSFAAGIRNIKVNLAGTATTAIEADLRLDVDGNYTVFAVDTGANLGPLVLVDDLTAPAAGFAHVRFVHLSPDAPPVNIDVGGGGGRLFADYEFKEASAFTPVATGTYDLEVRLVSDNSLVLPLNGIVLEDGKIYTVFARGFAGGADAATYPLGAEIVVSN
jgi:hypothetical protein